MSILRTLVAGLLFLILPPVVCAQTPATAPRSPVTVSLRPAVTPPGPLARAARSPLLSGFDLMTPLAAPPSPAVPYQWRRGDWEFGRAWIGASLGFFYGWFADMVAHYQTDFSKANWLWNEGLSSRGHVIHGEVVYNVLFYNGLAPLYATRGVRNISPIKGDFLGTYLTALAGGLGGMAYWTQVDDLYAWHGFAVFTGLTALGAWIGNRIWK